MNPSVHVERGPLTRAATSLALTCVCVCVFACIQIGACGTAHHIFRKCTTIYSSPLSSPSLHTWREFFIFKSQYILYTHTLRAQILPHMVLRLCLCISLLNSYDPFTNTRKGTQVIQTLERIQSQFTERQTETAEPMRVNDNRKCDVVHLRWLGRPCVGKLGVWKRRIDVSWNGRNEYSNLILIKDAKCQVWQEISILLEI